MPDVIHYSTPPRGLHGAEISIQISALARVEPQNSHLSVQHATATPPRTLELPYDMGTFRGVCNTVKIYKLYISATKFNGKVLSNLNHKKDSWLFR